MHVTGCRDINSTRNTSSILFYIIIVNIVLLYLDLMYFLFFFFLFCDCFLFVRFILFDFIIIIARLNLISVFPCFTRGLSHRSHFSFSFFLSGLIYTNEARSFHDNYKQVHRRTFTKKCDHSKSTRIIIWQNMLPANLRIWNRTPGFLLVKGVREHWIAFSYVVN